jgi:hypothetical protein
MSIEDIRVVLVSYEPATISASRGWEIAGSVMRARQEETGFVAPASGTVE